MKHKKTMMLLLVMLSVQASADQIARQPRQYGSLKEVVFEGTADASPFQMKQGAERDKLAKQCEGGLGSTAFDLYVLKTSGKKINVIADSSGEGQNIFPTDYYVVNQKCEKVGETASLSAVANEPKGTYHQAYVLVDGKGDAVYFLAEEKYGPGKVCMSPASCERMKGYAYSRDLYKITDRGFVPVIKAKKKNDKDVDVDALIPLGLN